MLFIVDTQLPAALARYLSAHGHHAEHVLDLGMGRARDDAIWSYAKANLAIVISKDEDFIQFHLRNDNGPQIVWVRCGNVRKQALLDIFARTLPHLLAALTAGEPIVEIS